MDSFENFKNLNNLKGEEIRKLMFYLTPKVIIFLKNKIIQSLLLTNFINLLKSR